MPSAIEIGAPRHRWSHARACTGLALALLCGPAHAEWEIGATAGAFYDDNLTRAQDNVDKRPDGAATANVTGTRFIPLTGSDGVTFTLYGRGELFDRYS